MIRSLDFSQARSIAKKENATVKDAVPRWYWCHWSIETRVCNSLVTFYGVKQTVRGQGTDSQIKSFIQGRPTYRTISVPEVEIVQPSANKFTCLKKASMPSSESIVSISLLAWGRDYNSRLSKASEKGSCLLGQGTGTRKSLTSWRWGGNRQLQAPKADNNDNVDEDLSFDHNKDDKAFNIRVNPARASIIRGRLLTNWSTYFLSLPIPSNPMPRIWYLGKYADIVYCWGLTMVRNSPIVHTWRLHPLSAGCKTAETLNWPCSQW